MSILKDLGVPAFKAGGMPVIDLQNYFLSIGGLVKEERHFSMAGDIGVAEEPGELSPDFCVGLVGSSRLGRYQWNDFLRLIPIESGTNRVRFTSVGGGYSTTVSLKDLENPRVLLAYGVNGNPIEAEYGGPLRMVIPNLWGYKSCKWLGKIEFINQEEGGYWEDRGYTRSGLIEPGFTFDINTQTRRPIKGGEVVEF